MRIADSHVSMGAARQYYQMGSSNGKQTKGSFMDYVSEGSESNYEYHKTEHTSDQDGLAMKSPVSSEVSGNTTDVVISKDTLLHEMTDGVNRATKLQFSLLNQLMRRLFYLHMAGGPGMLSPFGNMIPGGSILGMGTNGMISQRIIQYEEYEDTTFYANGKAITEDGRQIDFHVDVTMSRSYMEYADIPIMQLGNALCDPLVINLDSTLTQISDQKFRFDLDTDGIDDEISMPGSGSGFLVLDHNKDGIINDGSELFGTKSGDGFADLRMYDSDGNGWIDENDEIFDRLKVWCKGSQGEDILMNLKEAEIGAIFLGAKETEFSMYGMNGGINGIVRATGFFLKECGEAGTIQHVDLATKTTVDPKRAEYMSNRMEGGPLVMDSPNGAVTIAGLNLTAASGSIDTNSKQRQQSINQQIARERNDRNYRARTARNKRLQEERIARQRKRRQELREEEENRVIERQIKRQEVKEELIEKLLEDQPYSYRRMIPE